MRNFGLVRVPSKKMKSDITIYAVGIADGSLYGLVAMDEDVADYTGIGRMVVNVTETD